MLVQSVALWERLYRLYRLFSQTGHLDSKRRQKPERQWSHLKLIWISQRSETAVWGVQISRIHDSSAGEAIWDLVVPQVKDLCAYAAYKAGKGLIKLHCQSLTLGP